MLCQLSQTCTLTSRAAESNLHPDLYGRAVPMTAESNLHPHLYGRAVPMGSLGAFVALAPSARSLQADPPRGRS